MSLTLAPEHGRAAYGSPRGAYPPWEIYGEEDSGIALRYVMRSLENAIAILRRLGYP